MPTGAHVDFEIKEEGEAVCVVALTASEEVRLFDSFDQVQRKWSWSYQVVPSVWMRHHRQRWNGNC